MNRKEVRELIEEGENLQIEFKRKFTTHEKIAREMIAFANTRGGVILFGVDDDKKIIGVDSEKEEADLALETAADYCIPSLEVQINYFNIDDKEIVAVSIPESKQKPHRLQDYKNEFDITTAEVTVRVNDKSILAGKEMIRLLRVRNQNLNLKKYSFGKLEAAVFEFLKDNENITVRDLCKFSNISERRASRTLVKLVRADLLYIHVRENGVELFTSAM